MNFRALNVLVAIGMAALIATAVYKAGPGAVAPQIADALRPPPPSAAPDPLVRGVEFLRSRRSPDGAWRSDVYATFRDGTALTPLVAVALQTAEALPDERKAATTWLAGRAKPDGSIDEGPDGLPYPVYTAALSVTALSHPENAAHAAARDAWLKYLLARQLTEANGWSVADAHYGGWGYYPLVPKKPTPGQGVPAQHLLESNLSATAFALDALRASGVTDPAVWRPAVGYVLRRQNDDGGFHFVVSDPVRNKAGGDGGGFNSYGSATADGARSLAMPGDKPDGFQSKALKWLDVNFAADRHPGTYITTHEPNRDAVYFYYAASSAKTFRQSGATTAGGKPWADELAAALVAKQRPDGSWANPVELVRENDPVLATAYAVQALALCRPTK
jgi:hypothetical protein